eukprot:9498197-Pyramimonas_sp.AAC.2
MKTTPKPRGRQSDEAQGSLPSQSTRGVLAAWALHVRCRMASARRCCPPPPSAGGPARGV